MKRRVLLGPALAAPAFAPLAFTFYGFDNDGAARAAGKSDNRITQGSLRVADPSPFYHLDLALRRQFDFNERVALQVRAEAFNLLNHPNFDDPVSRLATSSAPPGAPTAFRLDPYFGRSVSAGGGGEWIGQAGGFGPLYTAGGARAVQLSLKLTF